MNEDSRRKNNFIINEKIERLKIELAGHLINSKIRKEKEKLLEELYEESRSAKQINDSDREQLDEVLKNGDHEELKQFMKKLKENQSMGS